MMRGFDISSFETCFSTLDGTIPAWDKLFYTYPSYFLSPAYHLQYPLNEHLMLHHMVLL